MDSKAYNQLRKLQARMTFEQQRADAIRREQENKCYRQYEPPQIHELSHQYARS